MIGETLNGKWRIDHLLGVGGTATVYAATHRNGRSVAIKMLHARLAGDSRLCRRFQREGYVANRVDHPAVVVIEDDDVCAQGYPFLVMEKLEGMSLEQLRTARGGILDVAVVVRAGAEALDALQAAHEKCIIHRDIKPSNLFLTRTGEIRILDFGAALFRERDENERTLTGALLGTPAFMSPEQARPGDGRVTPEADIYAVGATLFTLLAGRHVHDAPTRAEQLGKVMTVQARSLALLRPELSAELVAVIDRALRYDPRERWPTADAFRKALLGIVFEANANGTADRAPTIRALPDAEPPSSSATVQVVTPPRTSVARATSVLDRTARATAVVGVAATLLVGALSLNAGAADKQRPVGPLTAVASVAGACVMQSVRLAKTRSRSEGSTEPGQFATRPQGAPPVVARRSPAPAVHRPAARAPSKAPAHSSVQHGQAAPPTNVAPAHEPPAASVLLNRRY